MYPTRNVDALAAALLSLMGRLNSPRQDEVLLRAAGVSLDRALFPLLVRLSSASSMSVAKLAEQLGRDPSTVSRQLAKLEELGLVRRPAAAGDQRLRNAVVSNAGVRTVTAITAARRRLLTELTQDWSPEEQEALPRLLQRLVDAMQRHPANRDERS